MRGTATAKRDTEEKEKDSLSGGTAESRVCTYAQCPTVEPTTPILLAAGSEARQLYPRRSGIFRPLASLKRAILRSIPSYSRDLAFANFPAFAEGLLKLRHAFARISGRVFLLPRFDDQDSATHQNVSALSERTICRAPPLAQPCSPVDLIVGFLFRPARLRLLAETAPPTKSARERTSPTYPDGLGALAP